MWRSPPPLPARSPVRLSSLPAANMLALISRLLDWFRSLFWKEEMELTLVGLQYSGKTTFVNVIAVSALPLALPGRRSPRVRPGVCSKAGAGGGGGGPLSAAGLWGVCVSGEGAAVLGASPSVRTWTFSRVGGSSVSVRSAVEELFPFSRLLPSTVSSSRPGFGKDVIGLVTFLRPLGGLEFPSLFDLCWPRRG